MANIRMNTEFRNKILNRYREYAENENTQEREAYLQARENVNAEYGTAFELAKTIVQRAYPIEDVKTLRHFKQKYGDPCDVVAKDKCFYFAHSEDVDDEGDKKETSSHFDFGLYGNLNGQEYDSDEGRKFAYAYYRDELKAKSLNADILAEQEGKSDNPYKTKHIEENDKFLGYSGSRYSSDDNNSISLTRDFNDHYKLDVIGTSHCRSRTIPCSKSEYEQLEQWRIAKASLVSSHQKWIDTIKAQCEAMKTGLKAYKFLSEGIELMSELGVQIDEAELVRCNSTGLTIYNPTNLANMIKGMKNKSMTREQKILLRQQYEKNQVN
jgi:hypothetical protein